MVERNDDGAWAGCVFLLLTAATFFALGMALFFWTKGRI
jgi:hypothetical protein